MSEVVLNLHIFYILIYLWYHQPLVCGCGMPNDWERGVGVWWCGGVGVWGRGGVGKSLRSIELENN
jgi:hypothetical protein